MSPGEKIDAPAWFGDWVIGSEALDPGVVAGMQALQDALVAAAEVCGAGTVGWSRVAADEKSWQGDAAPAEMAGAQA